MSIARRHKMPHLKLLQALSSKSVYDYPLQSIFSAGEFFSDLRSQAQNTFNEAWLIYSFKVVYQGKFQSNGKSDKFKITKIDDIHKIAAKLAYEQDFYMACVSCRGLVAPVE